MYFLARTSLPLQRVRGTGIDQLPTGKSSVVPVYLLPLASSAAQPLPRTLAVHPLGHRHFQTIHHLSPMPNSLSKVDEVEICSVVEHRHLSLVKWDTFVLFWFCE